MINVNKYNYGILVAGAIKSVADGGIVTYTSDIHDKNIEVSQDVINTQLFLSIEDIKDLLSNFVPSDVCKCKWRIVTEQEYNNIQIEKDVLYFIINEQENIISDVRLDGTTIISNYLFQNQTVIINGTLYNEVLTL